jgi:MoxR-like ATPase
MQDDARVDVRASRRMAHPAVSALLDGLDAVIIGKGHVTRRLLCGLLAGGHVLVEDVPGVGKTLMARTLASVLSLSFSRIQFTPDMLPGDLLGMSVWDPAERRFDFRPGPVFTHLLVADEINRTSPRTQSALLEAMEERQVTVDGKTYPLEPPFMVVATQNPLEYEGTFPLPESQLDRFLFRLSVGYPDADDERRLLARTALPGTSAAAEPVTGRRALLALQQAVREVVVSDHVVDYLADLLGRTRLHPDLCLGASPRAGQALLRAAQAWAFMDGRPYVIPDDIKDLVPDVLGHRLLPLMGDIREGHDTVARVLTDLLAATPVPRGGAR